MKCWKINQIHLNKKYSLFLHEDLLPGYDTKLHLMMKLKFWRSRECGIPLHYNYSQNHTDLEWWYLLGFHLGVKYFKITHIQQDSVQKRQKKILRNKYTKNINMNIQFLTSRPKLIKLTAWILSHLPSQSAIVLDKSSRWHTVSTQLMNGIFCWSTNTDMSMCKSPYQLVLTYTVVINMDCSPYLDGLQDERM